MRITILHFNVSVYSGYSLYCEDTKEFIIRENHSFCRGTYFDEDNIFNLIGEENFKKWENEESDCFQVPKEMLFEITKSEKYL